MAIAASSLSFFVPGLGQAFAGRFWRGIVFAVLVGIVTALIVASFLFLPGIAGLAVPVVFGIGFRILASRDAFLVARDDHSGLSLAKRIGFAALMLVVAAVVQIPETRAITGFLGGAYRLPSNSMSPRLLAGDYMVTVPVRHPLGVGDIVAYRSPTDSTKEFVKRIVGAPGDTIGMENGHLIRNGRSVTEAYAHHDEPDLDPVFSDFEWQTPYHTRHVTRPSSRNNWGPLLVPANSYFVLGDDRDNSLDSRYLGFVRRSDIKSIPLRIYFSRDSLTGIRWSRIGQRVQ